MIGIQWPPDPETGETLINDALGSIGTNNTSVDGNRATLAEDMVNLETYLQAHRKQFSPDSYNWLKKVTRTGMELAFGTPGLPPADQPAVKSHLLAQFHDISANPTSSILHSTQYFALEALFQNTEQAYLTAGTKMDQTNFLSIDPIAPAINKASTLIDSSLATRLTLVTLEPTMAELSSSMSPYAYSAPITSTTVPLQPIAATVSTATSSLSPTNTINSPTVSDYYSSTLGVRAPRPVTNLTTNTVSNITTPTTSTLQNTTKTLPSTNSSKP